MIKAFANFTHEAMASRGKQKALGGKSKSLQEPRAALEENEDTTANDTHFIKPYGIAVCWHLLLCNQI